MASFLLRTQNYACAAPQVLFSTQLLVRLADFLELIQRYLETICQYSRYLEGYLTSLSSEYLGDVS